MKEVKNNTLYIGNVSTKELAARYGTPLYIYDQALIEQKMDDFKAHFVSSVFETNVVYASKAFLCTAMAKLVKKHGLYMDVVSGGELYVAAQAGFDMRHIVFHGNNKSVQELEMAARYGAGTIVIDNEAEARELAALSFEQKTNVLLRINPGVEAHTHQFIVTAHVDSKFGILKSDTETIRSIIDTIESNEALSFQGFHAHIGSQIFDKNAFRAEIETMGSFIKEMIDKTGRSFPALDLGGGFAAVYTKEDTPIPIDEVCAFLIDQCWLINEKYGLHLKRLMIEPGRSIVAEAGSTLYTVGFTKITPHKKYVFVDGGMSDNIRPALYQAAYDADLANRMNDKKTETVCIAGKCCESGDVLIEKTDLPCAVTGDQLIVYTTGAYGYSMASRYNMLCIPAVVFVKDGQSSLVVRRQSFEDLIERDEGEIL